jgi:hypothetical protein
MREQKAITLPWTATWNFGSTPSWLTGQRSLTGPAGFACSLPAGFAGAFSSGIFAANAAGSEPNRSLQPPQQKPMTLP